jgi:hypothetical protein
MCLFYQNLIPFVYILSIHSHIHKSKEIYYDNWIVWSLEFNYGQSTSIIIGQVYFLALIKGFLTSYVNDKEIHASMNNLESDV